jgi:hypothetical protein
MKKADYLIDGTPYTMTEATRIIKWMKKGEKCEVEKL